MRTTAIIVALLLIVSMFTACGGGGPKAPKGVQQVYYPDWWRVQDDTEHVNTFGMATKVSQNMSYDAAYSDAMLQAAQYVEAYVKGMVKNYEEEAGVNDPQNLALTSKVVKVISEAKFSNALVNKQETITLENNRFQTFVRVAIPKDTINKNVVDNIRNEEALYNQFKASQSFKELEEELKNK